MGAARSAYYAWKRRVPGKRERSNLLLLPRIRMVFQAGRGVYGAPRVYRTLKKQGFECGRHRVAKLMRLDGLEGKRRKRFVKTTDSEHDFPVAENLLNQDFEVKELNKVWLSDIWASQSCAA